MFEEQHHKPNQQTWLFAYGSLMWDADIPALQSVRATLNGYHRAFTHKSTTNWGTPNHPGPVLGLEEGGECTGIAFLLPPEQSRAILSDVQEREGPSYRYIVKQVQQSDGHTIRSFITINRRDVKYLGDLSLKKRVNMARQAEGTHGSADEYARKTYQKLHDMNIDDPFVEEFVRRLKQEVLHEQ